MRCKRLRVGPRGPVYGVSGLRICIANSSLTLILGMALRQLARPCPFATRALPSAFLLLATAPMIGGAVARGLILPPYLMQHSIGAVYGATSAYRLGSRSCCFLQLLVVHLLFD